MANSHQRSESAISITTSACSADSPAMWSKTAPDPPLARPRPELPGLPTQMSLRRQKTSLQPRGLRTNQGLRGPSPCTQGDTLERVRPLQHLLPLHLRLIFSL